MQPELLLKNLDIVWEEYWINDLSVLAFFLLGNYLGKFEPKLLVSSESEVNSFPCMRKYGLLFGVIGPALL